MSRLRDLLAQPLGLPMLEQANVQSLQLMQETDAPGVVFAIAGATRLLADRFRAGEPNPASWHDLVAATVIPSMLRALDAADPATPAAARTAALDELATACERALRA